MPIYEYQCKKCENVFEYFHVGSDDNNVVCPACNSEEVEKVMSFGQVRANGIKPSPTYSFPSKKYPV